MDSKDPKFNSEMWEKLTILVEVAQEVEGQLEGLIYDLHDLRDEFRKEPLDA